MKSTVSSFLAAAVLTVFLISCVSTQDRIMTPQEQTENTTPVPVFDRPHAIVLDMWSYGRRYEDYIKVYSALQRENITFNVYGYNAKNETWILIGPAMLKKSGDRDTIDSPLRGKLNQFRWFAIHSLDNLDFNAQAVISRNDILITVLEE